jgi:C4-dicarboxylate-binding protein DctP
MDAKDLERREWLGVLGAGAVAAAITALAMPWPAQGQSPIVIKATVDANHIAKRENEQALEKIKASGKTAVYVPTAPERAALRKALAPVHKETEGRIGRDTIQAVYKETGVTPD